MAQDLIIPYYSVPDYDNWGSDTFWNLATWVGWHRGLVSKFGSLKDKNGYSIADKTWLNAWVKQSTASSPLLALFQPTRFKSETDYLKKFPLIYEYSGLKRATEQINPLETSYKFSKMPFDVAESVAETGGNIADGIGTAGKVLKYAIPALLITGVVLLAIYGYKKVKSA